VGQTVTLPQILITYWQIL